MSKRRSVAVVKANTIDEIRYESSTGSYVDLENLKNKGVNYFFVVENDFYPDLKLLEEHYVDNIITQNVKWDVFQKVQREQEYRQIVDNLCFKFNMKSGGINHIVTMDNIV